MEHEPQNQSPQDVRERRTPDETATRQSRQAPQRAFWARPWVWIIIICIALAAGTATLAQTGAISLSLPGLSGGNGNQNGDTVIATVNGESVTQEQLDSRMAQLRQNLNTQNQTLDAEQEAQLQQQALDNLINETLVLQEANADGVTVSDTEVNQALAQIKDRFENEQAYQDELTNNSLTEEVLTERVRRELVVQKYLSSNVSTDDVTVTDAEVQSAYDGASSQQEGLPPLAEIREQIVAQLEQQKVRERVQQLIAGLRTEASIETNL